MKIAKPPIQLIYHRAPFLWGPLQCGTNGSTSNIAVRWNLKQLTSVHLLQFWRWLQFWPTKELNIFSGPLVTILTNRHQGIVSICKLHSLHQNHIPSPPNLDKGSGRMFRRQILAWVKKRSLDQVGWVHKKPFSISATKFWECAYCASPDQTEGEKRVTRKLQISPLFSEIRTCPYISCLCIELYIASPPPPRPLLQYFQQREVQVSEGPIEQKQTFAEYKT